MASLSRSALLPYSLGSVFGIVSDVGRYADFLPWCRASVIDEQDEHTVTATLEFGGRGLSERLTTRNTMVPGARIEVGLVSGPFTEFAGVWRFTALGEDLGCKVEFALDYRLAGAHRLLGGRFIDHAADRLVDAFADRCAQLLDADTR